MNLSDLPRDVVAAVRSVVGDTSEFVLLHGPYLPPNAWVYTKDCLDTGWVSSAGKYVSRFEEELARFVGIERAVAVVNGTAALEMCFRLVGTTTNDEIICPSLTFVATANAITHCGGVPHFVDIESGSLGLCPQALAQRLKDVADRRPNGTFNRETGRRIGAVCVMHCFGHPAQMDELVEVCQQYDLPLVEDAAESLGSYYRDEHTGRRGTIAAVSFNGNKILTTGGGGAILTDDETLADKAKHLTTTAKVPHAWEFHHDAVGWNYRMPNLNAAIGCAQLEVLPRLLDAKRTLYQSYLDAFAPLDGVGVLQEPEYGQSNHWLNCIVLDPLQAADRDAVLAALNADQLQSRPLWQPMHHLPMYCDVPRGPLANTDDLYRRCVNIPSSASLVSGWES
ncbi:MAG: LegC family aminotransferase [Aureliella sp.]